MKNYSQRTEMERVLRDIWDLGIKSLPELKEYPGLHSDLWITACSFSRCCLKSATHVKRAPAPERSGGQAQGHCSGQKSGQGNRYKVQLLEEHNLTTAEDLEIECAEKLAGSLAYILAAAPCERVNYCSVIVNNTVNDYFKQPPFCQSRKSSIREILSLDCPLSSEEDADFSLGDMLADPSPQPQDIAVFRDIIGRALEELSDYPREAMVLLACKYLGLKPRELAVMVYGKDSSFINSLYHGILEQFSRELEVRIPGALQSYSFTASELLEGAPTQKEVSGRISHLSARALGHIGMKKTM